MAYQAVTLFLIVKAVLKKENQVLICYLVNQSLVKC